MNHAQPCFTDSDENRFPEESHEEESPLTITEQQIEWLFDDWKDALTNDSFDEWHAMQMQIYGAKQMLVNCAGRFNSDVYRVLDDLGNIAFENGHECIREGKYEGAPA